jgi:hypothetical protein
MPPKRTLSTQGPDAVPGAQKSKTKRAKIQLALENAEPLIKGGMTLTLPQGAFVKTIAKSSKAISPESHGSVSTTELCREADILVHTGSIRAALATHPFPRPKST